MTPSENLYDLIKSLTMSEKRHFRIFSSRHTIGGQNVYIKLFDAIEKQSRSRGLGTSGEYDERAIKQQFAGENFIRGLPKEKNYLYNIILKSLRVYYSGKTVSLRLKEWLDYAEILYLKGQYAQANKILEKVKKTARQHENQLFALEAYTWQKNIALANHVIPFSKRQVKKLPLTEEDSLIKAHKNIKFLNDTRIHLTTLLSQKGESRNKQETHIYTKIIKNAVRHKKELTASLNSSVMYYSLMADYHYAIGKHKEAAGNLKKMILLRESQPEILKEKLLSYKRMLNNYVTLTLESGNYKEAETALKKLKEIPQKYAGSVSQILDMEIFFSTRIHEAKYLISTVQLERFGQLIKEIKEGLAKFKKDINTYYEISLLYNIGYLYYISNEKRAALKAFNKITDMESDSRQDIQTLAKITTLIIHYELHNNDIVPYIRKTIQRYMEESEKLYPLETLLLDFFKDIGREKNKINVKQRLKKLKSDLVNLQSDPEEKRVFGNYFDFIVWVDSKLSGKSYADCLREKLLKKVS